MQIRATDRWESIQGTGNRNQESPQKKSKLLAKSGVGGDIVMESITLKIIIVGFRLLRLIKNRLGIHFHLPANRKRNCTLTPART